MPPEADDNDLQREFEGYWWLPDSPDVTWPGILSWRPGQSPKLTLRFRTIGEKVPPDHAEAIYGLDEGGTPITILRVGSIGGVHAGFLSHKDYRAGHILRGMHASSLRDFRANRVDFAMQYLDGWLNEEPFGPWDQSEETWRVEYRRPKERAFDLFPGTQLKLFHSTTSDSAYGRRSIRYEGFVGLEKERPFEFSQAFKRVNAFRSLLHFACLRRVRLTSMYFENFSHTFPLGEREYPRQLELYGGSIHPPLERAPDPFDYVFTFQDVKDDFSSFIAKWFKFEAEFREPLGCYTTTVYSSLQSEISLISMARALEAYHQRRFRPKAGTDDAKFVNRVRRLAERQESSLEPIVGDVREFAQSVADSRHYYTHHDPDIRRKGVVATGSALDLMTYRLQFLFRLSVLSDFGLERDPHDVLRRQLPSRIIEYF